MNRTRLTQFLAVMVFALVFAAVPARAQYEGSKPSKEDKSGTNPLNLQNQVSFYNEFKELPDDGGYANYMVARYWYPFNDQTNLVLKLPVVSTDVTGEQETGFGDAELRWNWIPYMSQKFGLVLGAEFFFDTATEDSVGTGKHAAAPLVVGVFMFPSGLLFAPAYEYKFSCAGDDDRQDISMSLIDLFTWYT